MTSIVIGWLLVAVVFLAAGRLVRGNLPARTIAVLVAESLVLTLLAALWFGTAGHGGWLLVFLPLALLVAASQPVKALALAPSGERPDWRVFTVNLARYLAAGALLAWRLG